MHTFEGQDGKWMVILERGEEVISQLTEFAQSRKITAGSLSGIGALEDVELGFYHMNSKTYDRKNFGHQEFELLSLLGNFSLMDGHYFTHLHAQLSDENYQCIGGHLFSAKVAVTCEITVVDLGTKLERFLDPEIGLNLIKP